jgi:hypothetical protein
MKHNKMSYFKFTATTNVHPCMEGKFQLQNDTQELRNDENYTTVFIGRNR